MKDNCDLLTRKVRKCARPITLTNGNNKAVLCIHGFSGYPGEMAFPASRLAENSLDVYVPRIGGHGTDGADFASRHVNEWVHQIADEWLDLNSRYDEVFILGHSMGGLLALNLARQYKVSKVAVMAPAIGVRNKGQGLIKPVSWFIKKKSVPWKSDAQYIFFDERDENDDEYLGKEYWSWAWLRHLSELRDIMIDTEKNLAEVKCPVLAIYGGKDDVIGKQSAPLLKKELKTHFEILHLPESGHYIPYEYREGIKEQAMDAVIKWFKG